MNTIPPQLVEAGVGTLLAMYAIKVAYMAYYLTREWKESASFKDFYRYENKAAFAMMTVATGMVLMLFSMLVPMYLHSHAQSINAARFVPSFVAGVGVAVWGLMCLLRALSRYDWPNSLWIVVGISAISFGILLGL